MQHKDQKQQTYESVWGLSETCMYNSLDEDLFNKIPLCIYLFEIILVRQLHVHFIQGFIFNSRQIPC